MDNQIKISQQKDMKHKLKVDVCTIILNGLLVAKKKSNQSDDRLCATAFSARFHLKALEMCVSYDTVGVIGLNIKIKGIK